jgi:nitrate reductase NapE
MVHYWHPPLDGAFSINPPRCSAQLEIPLWSKILLNYRPLFFKSVNSMQAEKEQNGKKWELEVFLFVTIIVALKITEALIRCYGFIVWIYQLIAGPPGPPG